jgi:drug/metabolite transporter (DMT)-like permease
MTRTDALLAVMVVIWGANFTVLKLAFEELPPQSFNSIRILVAAATFFIAIRLVRWWAGRTGRPLSAALYTTARLTARDRFDLVWLGLVGHCLYQLAFVGGVDLTSVANAALILGTTPVVVAVMSVLLGRERLSALHWTGVAVSFFGIYLVVGRGASLGGVTLEGDLRVMVSVLFWASYTIGAMRLVARHSPLYVTGVTLAIGAVPYVLIALPELVRTEWAAVSAWTWGALVWSALFAIGLAYLIWYTAVQRIGPTRTSAYANIVPVEALAVSALWLGEAVTPAGALGAGAILGGVFLTRIGRRPAAVPIEE